MVFRVGDDPIPVQWYFTDPGAKCFPGVSQFASANWYSRQAVAGALGEQPGPRPWVNGAKPVNGYIGDDLSRACAIAHADWWANGLGPGEEVGPFDANGVPLCCKTPPPCCECELPATMELEVFAASCACIHGMTFSMTRSGLECSWLSPIVDCGGHEWQCEVFVEGDEPPCSLQFRIYCDGVDVGQEGDSLDCESGAATVTINPDLNDCCNATHDLFLTWTPP